MKRRRRPIRKVKYHNDPSRIDEANQLLSCSQHQMPDCSLCKAIRERRTLTGEEYLALSELDTLFVPDKLTPPLIKYTFSGSGLTFKAKGFTPIHGAERLGDKVFNLAWTGETFICTDPDQNEIVLEFQASNSVGDDDTIIYHSPPKEKEKDDEGW